MHLGDNYETNFIVNKIQIDYNVSIIYFQENFQDTTGFDQRRTFQHFNAGKHLAVFLD